METRFRGENILCYVALYRHISYIAFVASQENTGVLAWWLTPKPHMTYRWSRSKQMCHTLTMQKMFSLNEIDLILQHRCLRVLFASHFMRTADDNVRLALRIYLQREIWPPNSFIMYFPAEKILRRKKNKRLDNTKWGEQSEGGVSTFLNCSDWKNSPTILLVVLRVGLPK